MQFGVRKVADQVTFDQFGADMVHKQSDDVTKESVSFANHAHKHLGGINGVNGQSHDIADA